MNSVIVLGATSMLGRELVRQLSAKGIEVIRAGRHCDSDIVVDLGSGKPPEFRYDRRADVLIHCAAAFGGDSPEGIRDNLCVNVAGCVQTLEIVRESGVKKIVYAGSVSSDTMLESGPIGSYGFSKAEAERILSWAIVRVGGHFCSLRLTQLWDTEGACCAHQPWFGRIVAYTSRGQSINMPPANGPRNFMHVSDAAQLLIRAAAGTLEDIHPVSYPVDIDLAEFAQVAYQIFGRGGRVIIDPAKIPFRKTNFPREEGIFEALGYQPQISPEQGLMLIRDAGTADRFGPMDVQ